MSREPYQFDQDKAAENERLQFALEAAGVGTWDYNLLTGQAQWSNICKQLFGLPVGSEVTASVLLEQVHADDRQRVAQANSQALSPINQGDHNVTFRTLNPDGLLRWVQAKGKTIRNGQQVVRFSGIVQDVTQSVLASQKAEEAQERYRVLLTQLEQLVQVRTEQLTRVNEELSTTNEEFIAANEELESTNQLLMHSNLNLEQFAYVASHDLQEPLRKVQQFGDILKRDYAVQLGEGLDYLERMQAAASRMSILIRDLLTYSRISTQHTSFESVSLNDIVTTVISDLDLVIAETRAEVQVETLPPLRGNRSQLEQLFLNLLTNALKFHRKNTTPSIQITVQTLIASNLPASVRPASAAKVFHCIHIKDNGIGFEEKFLPRIFQVFQRLHGRSEFAGTGIGLAICEKVVTNHGGAITATSQPGQGATFSVYLPV